VVLAFEGIFYQLAIVHLQGQLSEYEVNSSVTKVYYLSSRSVKIQSVK